MPRGLAKHTGAIRLCAEGRFWGMPSRIWKVSDKKVWKGLWNIIGDVKKRKKERKKERKSRKKNVCVAVWQWLTISKVSFHEQILRLDELRYKLGGAAQHVRLRRSVRGLCRYAPLLKYDSLEGQLHSSGGRLKCSAFSNSILSMFNLSFWFSSPSNTPFKSRPLSQTLSRHAWAKRDDFTFLASFSPSKKALCMSIRL